jgi:DNA repair protein RadA/Sms
MAKRRTVYVCRSCGGMHARWMGKCPDCSAWDSLEEQTIDPNAEKDPQAGLVSAWGELQSRGAGAAGGGAEELTGGEVGAHEARPLREIRGDGPSVERLPSGISEFDRVLGGAATAGQAGSAGQAGGRAVRGLVPGSAVLVGGEPGIGKSTLLLQAAFRWAAAGTRVLYVSSEESAEQIGMRARRVGGAPGADDAHDDDDGDVATADAAGGFATTKGEQAGDWGENLFVLADTNLARIAEQTRRVLPRVLIIDSVQMIYKSDLPAGPGSITQLRRCCAELVYLAKASGISVILVGHVTKDGELAGPRLLEHLVDAVLYFEGDRYHSHRVVRAVKNRFGSTLEIGLFEMTGAGLRELPEGAGVAAVTLSDTPRPGSVVCPVLTGTRCVLVEIQALTATGFVGAAKRKSSGLDANRLAMLIAVLEQHAELRLADRDIFASAVGGLRVIEPAADLSTLLAIAGAHLRKPLSPATAAVGEVGLGGEIRPVPQMEQRAAEAARLGFKRLIVPGRTSARSAGKGTTIPGGPAGLQLVPVRTVLEAMKEL